MVGHITEFKEIFAIQLVQRGIYYRLTHATSSPVQLRVFTISTERFIRNELLYVLRISTQNYPKQLF